MTEDLLVEFERHRAHLDRVAYRMLGSTRDAEDAVQETWIRVQRADPDTDVDNVGGWLTTIVARVSLNVLRARRARPAEAAGVHLPDPVVIADDGDDPAAAAELADSVTLAMLVVLDTLHPAERLAFVLHDMFAVPFDEIAALLGRTPVTARQLASRGRRRVRDVPVPVATADRARAREVVDAFFAASRAGDFDALVALLAPDIEARTDGGPDPGSVRGADAVARRALRYANPVATLRPVLVNGQPGVIVNVAGRAVALLAFTVAGGHIIAIDGINDASRLARLSVLGE